MNHKVLQTVYKQNLIQKNDKVVVGVSGGADSMALLCFLYQNRVKLGIEVAACHINHMLRAQQSVRDESVVEAYCKALCIPFFVTHVDIASLAKERKISVEECGRQERYRFFEKTARQFGANKIATAHTLNDRAETTLLNLIRGTGAKGLISIQPMRGNIIRPLLFTTRQEVESYCGRFGIPFVTDSSNLQENYTRNKIRHNILPVMQQINPNVLQSVLRLQNTLQEDEEYLQACAQNALLSAKCPQGWDCAQLAGLPPSILKRALKALVLQYNAPYDQKRLDLLQNIVRRQSGGVQICRDLWFLVQNGCLTAQQGPKKPSEPFAFALQPGEYPLPDGRNIKIAIIHRDSYKNFKKINENNFTNVIDYDKIWKNAKIRSKLDGDRIRLAGQNITKPVKKLFQQAHVPLQERLKKVVLADEQGILWLEGFGPASRCSISKDTANLLLIDITEGKK